MTKQFINLFLATLLLISCKEQTALENSEASSEAETTAKSNTSEDGQFFKLSLAQWSLHEPMMSGKLDPMDFAQKAKQLGFDGIEYVSFLYRPEIAKYDNTQDAIQKILVPLKLRSEHFGVENLIIMVDDEGDLADADPEKRSIAVRNHSVWVDAAEYLGCHSIRVNLFGSEDDQRQWLHNSISSLKRVATYAAQKNINVIVENHGGFSSNAGMLAKVMKGVNLPNCGTLPDFGNFCVQREGGARWEAPCIEEYDKYKGIEELMPFAKGVSAKSYAFDENGNETTIDYERMLRIVKESGFDGYIGVEYEGDLENPEEGIKATKDLLIKTAKAINK